MRLAAVLPWKPAPPALPAVDFAEIPLETEIPIPPRRRARPVYGPLLETLKVGTSKAIPAGHEKKLRQAGQDWARTHPGTKFVVRVVSDNDVRIWRVA